MEPSGPWLLLCQVAPHPPGRGRAGSRALLGGLSEGWRSLSTFSSCFPGFGLGLVAGFCIEHRFVQSVHETPQDREEFSRPLQISKELKMQKSFLR